MKVKELYEILQGYYSNGWGEWEIKSYADGAMLPFEEDQIGEELLSEQVIIY